MYSRWEEEPREEGVKWRTLEHRGPVFADPYQRLPSDVHFYYNGRAMTLSDTAEEVAGFYARMLDHDYTTRDMFNTNFMKDWRKVCFKIIFCHFTNYLNSESGDVASPHFGRYSFPVPHRVGG